MNERELVGLTRELFSPRIGDDGAVVGNQVFTADMLVEDVDFTKSIEPHFIARKALAVNLSDLAAMGATPKYALLSLALPEWALRHAQEFLESFASAAKQHKIEIIGGDFSRADKLTIAITAIGEIEKRALLRSGARRGDRVYLSRPIGGAATGLALLNREVESYAEREFAQSAIRRQLDPEPEVALGIALAAIDKVTACMDVSDGLSTDIHKLCEASQCGAELERERIPIFPDLLAYGPKLGIRASDVVLHGGEEYALLFTSSLTESQLSTMVKRPVYAIGKITGERGVVIKENGVARPLEARGFDHFE